jgi:hypothetical protein
MVKRYTTVVLILALLTCAPLGANAAGGIGALTPMGPGFHQYLKCNGGYVTLDVAADSRVEQHAALITTTIAVGPQMTKTRTLRVVDGQGNIYSLGYDIDGAIKRFPKRLLLPAAPPPAGERSSYFNISGAQIEKRFEGTKSTTDEQQRPMTGYVFSDYLNGQKLNTVVYVPSVGLTEARFFALNGGGNDFVCQVARS